MLLKIYKTLFFALLSVFFWVGSVILAFFGGAIFQSMVTDKKEKEQAEKDNRGHAGHVRYTGLRMNATSGNLRRPYNAETSKNWSEDFEVNMLFLRTVQNHMNDKLRARGHVFLNDVYDELGMKRTSHGAIAGWLFRDNVLIGFVPNDLEPGDDIELEFDYDGVIYDRLVVLD
jgi:hypothetical protein